MDKTQENIIQNKKSFILYLDSADIFEQLTDQEAGKLIKAVLFYVHTGEKPKLSRILNMAFTPIYQSLHRDLEKWRKQVEANRINGKSGGRPKGKKTQKNPKNPSGYFNNPKNPDSVNDNDNEDIYISNFLNNIIKSWEKHYPNEFRKDGKRQTSYVIARRKELEKLQSREKIVEYISTYHGKEVLDDDTIAPPENKEGVVGLGGQLIGAWD